MTENSIDKYNDLVGVFVKCLVALGFLVIGWYAYVFIKKLSGIYIGIALLLAIVINLFSNYCNGSEVVDLNSLRFNNILLYYSAAISGSTAVLLISKIIEKNRILEFFGIHSLLMMYVNCFYHLIGIIYNVIAKIFTINSVKFYIAYYIGILFYEIIIVELFFHVLPWSYNIKKAKELVNKGKMVLCRK